MKKLLLYAFFFMFFLFSLTVLILNSFSCADIREQGPQDSPPSGLHIGVARIDISPPVRIPKEGWGAQTFSESVGNHYPLVANAMVISNGKEQYCLIDSDDNSEAEEVRKRIEIKTGIPYSHVFISGVHTHSKPADSRKVTVTTPEGAETYKRYLSVLADKLVGVAWEAQQALQPCHVGGGKGSCTINVNRRFREKGEMPAAVGTNPEGFVDHDVIVARIDDAKGNPIAVIVNFQCHPTILAWENKYVSPDYPGFIRKMVETAIPGALCFFFQGGAGNQGPIEGFTGDLKVAERLGSILGLEAASVALGIDTVERQQEFEGFVESGAFIARQPWRVKGPKCGKLIFEKKMASLPRKIRSPKEVAQMEGKVREAEQMIKEAEKSGKSWKLSQAKSRHNRLSGRLARYKSSTESDEPLTMEIRALRIGEIAFFFMTGEPFAEIGAAVRKNSPFKYTMFCGYTSTSGTAGGYMPIALEYPFGGYEVFGTRYAPEAADVIVKEAGMLLDDVNK